MPVEAGLPKKELRVSQAKILYVSVPETIPKLVRSSWVLSTELIVTVSEVLAAPETAPPVLAEEAIRKRRPSAAPLVIWIR
jgi:hypothetical protein